MIGPKSRVGIVRRISGARNAAGESSEEWLSVDTDVNVHIQPLSMSAMAALAQDRSGQLFKSSHLVFFDTGTDIGVDDRIEDAGGNEYAIQHVQVWPSHIEATAGITNKQS